MPGQKEAGQLGWTLGRVIATAVLVFAQKRLSSIQGQHVWKIFVCEGAQGST